MDFIIAADNATFSLPDAMVGIAKCIRRIGISAPSASTRQGDGNDDDGRVDDCAASLSPGMVNHVVPKAQPMPLALQLARKIVHNSPTAIEAQKQAMKYGYGQPTEMAVLISQMTNARAAIHPDYAECIRAFLEGREANFKDSDQ